MPESDPDELDREDRDCEELDCDDELPYPLDSPPEPLAPYELLDPEPLDALRP